MVSWKVSGICGRRDQLLRRHRIMVSVLFPLLLLSRFACLASITSSHVCVEAAEAASRFIFSVPFALRIVSLVCIIGSVVSLVGQWTMCGVRECYQGAAFNQIMGSYHGGLDADSATACCWVWLYKNKEEDEKEEGRMIHSRVLLSTSWLVTVASTNM